MNRRRLIATPLAGETHFSGSNERFGRAETRIKTIAAVHSQCPLWVDAALAQGDQRM